MGPAYEGSRISRKDALQRREDEDDEDEDEDEEEDDDDDVDEENHSDTASGSLISQGYDMSDRDKMTASAASSGTNARLANGTANGIMNGHKRLHSTFDADDFMSDADHSATNSDESGLLEAQESSQSSIGDDEEEFLDDAGSSEDDKNEDEDKNDDDNDEAASRAAVRRILQDEQKIVTANTSRAIRADIEKGRAVKKQKTAFDSLLNVRIKMQQALTAANTLPLADDIQRQDENPAEGTTAEARSNLDDKVKSRDTASINKSQLDAAEQAALNLWKSLTTLRDSLLHAQDKPQKPNRESSTSHRHHDVKSTTSSEALWQIMLDQEQSSIPTRHAILNKWSTRLRGSNPGSSSSNHNSNINHTRRINPSSSIHLRQQQHLQQQSLPDLLATDLMPNSTSHNRLIARAHTVRSCAPTHSSRGLNTSQDIYDDADFYGSLLQTFLEQRGQHGIGGGGEIIMGNGANTNGASAAAAGIAADRPLFFAPRWQAAKAAKVKKVVDTRASKGRKLKYTVHEKLQNFMAPEDRGTWDEGQTDELFGSLFGRKIGLDEEESQDESDGEGHGGMAGEKEAEASYLLYGR